MITSKIFSDSKNTREKKDRNKALSNEFKTKKILIKAKFSPFIDRLSRIQKNLKAHKRALNLIAKIDAAFKRNSNNSFEMQKDFSSLYQNKEKAKINLIKYFLTDKAIHLSKEQINLFLAEKFLKDLQIENNLEFITERYLNKIDLNVYTKIRSSIINFLTDDIKEALFNIVLQSKISDSINLAASNAITLLNKSEFSFKNKDLSKIKIPNADLSWGLFINTNFESSNLYGVNFSNSNLYNSNFRKCNMINVNFGEILNFCFEENPTIISFSPCGRFIASATDNKISLYQAKTYQEISRYENKKWCIDFLLFSDDGNYFVFHVAHEFTYLLNVAYNLQIAEFQEEKPYSFSPCSNYLCLALYQTTAIHIARIYSIKAKQLIYEIKYHDKYFFLEAKFLPSGEKLITLNLGILRIWNLSTQTEIMRKRYKYIYGAAFSFNRKYFTIYTHDLKTTLYNTENLEPITYLVIGSEPIAFSPCGRYLVSTETWLSKIVDLWNVNKIIETNQLFKGFLAQGKFIFVMRYKNLISLQFKLKDKEKKQFLPIIGIKDVSFSNDSQYFAVLTHYGTIFVLFTENQKLLKKIQAISPNHYKSIAWTDSFLAATNNDTIKIWNIYDESLFKVINISEKPENIKFSNNGKKIAMCCIDFIDILDIDNNLILSRLKVNRWGDIGWVWFNCGNFVSVMMNKNHEIIWSIDNQTILFKNKAIERDSLISISHCDLNLILIGKSKIINVWNLENREQDRKEIRKIKEFSSDYNITKIMWSPDGNNIIACDERGNIIVWNYTSEKIIKKIAAQNWAVQSLDVSTRGSFIISSGGINGAAKIWEL